MNLTVTLHPEKDSIWARATFSDGAVANGECAILGMDKGAAGRAARTAIVALIEGIRGGRTPLEEERFAEFLRDYDPRQVVE